MWSSKGKRKYSTKRKSGKGSVTKKLKALSKKVTRIDTGMEMKYNTGTISNTNIGVVPNVFDIWNIIPGLNQQARIGTKIAIQGFEVRFQLVPESLANTCSVRVLAVRDNANVGGASFAVGDLFATYSTYGIPSGMLYPPKCGPCPKRFTVFYDRTFDLENSGGSTNQSVPQTVIIKKTFKTPKVVTFLPGSTGGTATSISAGNISILVGANQALSSGCTVAGYCFLTRFTDA